MPKKAFRITVLIVMSITSLFLVGFSRGDVYNVKRDKSGWQADFTDFSGKKKTDELSVMNAKYLHITTSITDGNLDYIIKNRETSKEINGKKNPTIEFKIMSDTKITIKGDDYTGHVKIRMYDTPTIDEDIVLSELNQLCDIITFPVADETKNFIDEHSSLFSYTTESDIEDSENFNKKITYHHIIENIERYYNKIFYVKNATINKIQEEKLSDNQTATILHLTETDGFIKKKESGRYCLYYRGALTELVEDDTISFYAIPSGILKEDDGNPETLQTIAAINCYLD